MIRLKSTVSATCLIGSLTTLACLTGCPAPLPVMMPTPGPSSPPSAAPASASPLTPASQTPVPATSGSSSPSASPITSASAQASTDSSGLGGGTSPTPAPSASVTPSPAGSSPPAAQAVPMSSALSRFLVLAGQGLTNTGATSIGGDAGLSPAAPPNITGFSTVAFGNGGAIRSTADSASAQNDLTASYNAAAALGTSPVILGSTINGQTLAPGLYRTSAATVVGPQDLVLDASSSSDPANAAFVFQIHDALTTAAVSHVILAGGAQARNVYWQVGSSATLGANSAMKGNIIALTSITMGKNVNLQGRALARNAAVTLDTDTLIAP